MEFLPKSLGTRPRLACEVRAEGVVAARAEDASGLLSAVSRVPLADGIALPQLRLGSAAHAGPGLVPGPAASPSANGAGAGSARGNATDRAAVVAAVQKALEAVALRTPEVTLVVPDAAARVLLLDFDELPSKLAEALPVVRFRLKKLLPFDADDAAVSYQVMAASKGVVRVVAVAMPREVLAEYERVVREAGFEPGAVLPSTLAALAGLAERETPVLVVNVGRHGVTTAIVKGGNLLLHRTVDLRADLGPDALAESGDLKFGDAGFPLPLVNREGSAEEWARQQPVGHGDPMRYPIEAAAAPQIAVLEEELAAERGIAMATGEVVQAVSVAAAYFEDTLDATPGAVLAAGPMGAEELAAVLEYAGVGPVPVEEMVDRQMLGPGATSAGAPGGVPLGWLTGVRGALAD
jgi:type IV pilus assembly protein PilM